MSSLPPISPKPAVPVGDPNRAEGKVASENKDVDGRVEEAAHRGPPLGEDLHIEASPQAQEAVQSKGWFGWVGKAIWGSGEVESDADVYSDNYDQLEGDASDIQADSEEPKDEFPDLQEKLKSAAVVVRTNHLSKGILSRGKGALLSGVSATFWTAAGFTPQMVKDFGSSIAQGTVGVAARRYSANKASVVAESKKMIKTASGDEFIHIYDMIWKFLAPAVEAKIKEAAPGTDSSAILDWLEVNLVKGFENLSKQVALESFDSGKLQKQSPVGALMTLLSDKLGPRVEARKKEIDQKYQGKEELQAKLSKSLFKSFEDENATKQKEEQREQDAINLLDDNEKSKPERQKALDQKKTEREKDSPQFLINSYIKNSNDDPDLILELKGRLFPDLDESTDEILNEQINQFLIACIYLRQKNQELAQLFGEVSDDILKLLFPNKLNDFEIPGALKALGAADYLYNNYLKATLTNLLIDNYDQVPPILHTLNEREADKAKLKAQAPLLAALFEKIPQDIMSMAPEKIQGYREKLIKLMTKHLPKLDSAERDAIVDQVLGLFSKDSAAYKGLSGLAGNYLEGLLLKGFFINAERNPAPEGKDTFIVLQEKFTKKAAESYFRGSTLDPIKEAEAFNDWVVKELFGIDSPDFFKELPSVIRPLVYGLIKDQLGNTLKKNLRALDTLKDESKPVKQAKELAKKFGVGQKGELKGEVFLKTLSTDIATLVINAVPSYLAQKVSGEEIMGTNVILNAIESYVEELERSGVQSARLILDYIKRPEIQKMLTDLLTSLADPRKLTEDKKKAANLVANLILVPLTGVLDKVFTFENQHGQEFNQKLMANLLTVAADHFTVLNAANQKAKDGARPLQHADFVEAAGKKLHPAVLITKVSFEKSLDLIGRKTTLTRLDNDNLRKEIERLVSEKTKLGKFPTLDEIIQEIDQVLSKKEPARRLTEAEITALKATDDKQLTLRDVLRQEVEAPSAAKKAKAFGPASKTVMKMLFPNGKESLTFVDKALRDQVWSMFEQNLFPIVLPMITEILVSPDTINSIVLSSLVATRDSLNGEVKVDLDKKVETTPSPLSPLGLASGVLIDQILNIIQLPPEIKAQITDKNGQLTESIKQSIGTSLQAQFNGTFIQDKLKVALKAFVAPDSREARLLKFDASTPAAKAKKTAASRIKMQKDLKRASREVVNSAIQYGLVSQVWAPLQARFDRVVKAAFGDIGLKLKSALDMVFRFIFIKVIGTILSVLFYPVTYVIRETIYSYISLDANRDRLLSLLTKAPSDQPGQAEHVVYNEDLVYKLVETLTETIDETLTEDLNKIAGTKLPEVNSEGL